MTAPIACLLGLVAALSSAGLARAQTPQPAAPHETPQLAAPDAPKPPPEEIRPADRGKSATPDGTLSDRLSRQQGTLQPPAVDPGIHAPLPPRTSQNMPVIPPPGSPGGDPKVLPK